MAACSYPVLDQLAALVLGMSAGSVLALPPPDKLHKICFLHDNLQFILDSCDDIINE